MAFPSDNFRHGRVLKFFPQGSYGFVKDEEGREFYFHLDEVRLEGQHRERSGVREGVWVGFDIGLTSRGERVTRLKIYTNDEMNWVPSKASGT
ncbi:MAG: hypothetical protein HY542_07865 [Deltaproteobacteria bacterium]|nr:hypothetical protein [Deltaproteobacteria bacterium]